MIGAFLFDFYRLFGDYYLSLAGQCMDYHRSDWNRITSPSFIQSGMQLA